METENEKPTLYFITGHRGAGKTESMLWFLSDHPFLPDLYQYNDKQRLHWDQYRSDKDLQKYVRNIDKEMDAMDAHVAKQITLKENIYIEADCAAKINLAHLQNKAKDSHNTHIIFVLCDNLQQSVDRMAVTNSCDQKQLDRKEITADYHSVNKFLNKSGSNTKDRIDIYTSPQNKAVQLLATIDKGKVITAKPEIMTKIWLDPSGPLGRKIGKYMISQKKIETKTQVQKQAAHPAQILKQRKERKKRQRL